MQVTLKQMFLNEQLVSVISNMADTNDLLNVVTLDKNVHINRSLFVFFSKLLRSSLGSISSLDQSSTLLILPVNSKPLLDLQEILLKGHLESSLFEREDVKEVLNVCSLLGVKLTRKQDDMDNDISRSVRSLPKPIGVSEEVINPDTKENINDEPLETVQPLVRIKVEPEEYKELEQSSNQESFLGKLKEEPKGSANEKSQISSSRLTHEELIDEELMLTEKVNFGEGELNEDVLEIEPNEKEIEELLTATKTQIEKFFVRKPTENSLETNNVVIEEETSSEFDNNTIITSDVEDISTNDIDVEESSTSIKNNIPSSAPVNEAESTNYRYPCNFCNYKTNVGLNIKKHVKTIHNCYYTFTCKECKFDSTSEEKFKFHSCVHRSTEVEPDTKFECKLCSFKTHMPDFIQLHMKNIHDAYFIFKCGKCDFETSRYNKLSSHECMTSGSSGPGLDVGMDNVTDLCMRCGRYHATPCTRPLDCDYLDCGTKTSHSKSLHYPATLALYKAIQQRDSAVRLELPPASKDRRTGVKRTRSKGPAVYPCKECSYKTNKASMIKFHTKKNHQSQYLFSCTVCQFSTTDNKMFPSHKCKEELIKCPQCDFKASKALLVRRHINTQHETQVYSCGQCKYKCTTMDSFQQHQLLLCKGDAVEARGTTNERELFACDRCDYEGSNIHSLRIHKTTVHVNTAPRRQISRDHNISPYERSRSPLRKTDNFSPSSRSPADRSRTTSRPIRTPIRRRRSSSRSQASSRGPTTPFPPSTYQHMDPTIVEDRYPTQRPTRSNNSRLAGQNRKQQGGNPRNVLLCLRCGRRHGGECMHPVDSRCTLPGCGMSGHVATLHHPRTLNDYRLVKSKIKISGFYVNEPRTRK